MVSRVRFEFLQNTKVNTALNDNSDSLNPSSDERDDMEGDSAPKMDWTSKYLPTAWRAFRQHCEFTFGGPLKRKIEEEKCNYLMIWARDKGRDIYNTWELTADEVKKLETYYTRFETYVKPRSNKVFARYKLHLRAQQAGESFEQFFS